MRYLTNPPPEGIHLYHDIYAEILFIYESWLEHLVGETSLKNTDLSYFLETIEPAVLRIFGFISQAHRINLYSFGAGIQKLHL